MPQFGALEFERLWARVWQVACREEEIAEVGDFCEYLIGDQSILVVRSAPDVVGAYHNTCLHRGTRLAEGSGHFDDECIRCRYHAWRYDLDGKLIEVVDPEEFAPMPTRCLPRSGARRLDGAASCGSAWIRRHHHCSSTSTRCPRCWPRTTSTGCGSASYLSTVLPANWKVVVDAFNEGYHVQGTHPQILPWTDDVSLEYEPLGIHSHYGRLPNARRTLRPSPRLGLAEGEYDEGEILAQFVEGLGGLFYDDERALIDKIRSTPPDGETLLEPLPEGSARVAGDAGRRRRGVRRRPADERGRRLLLSQHGRPHLSRAPPSSSEFAPTGSIRTVPSRTPGSSSGPVKARSTSGPERRFYPDWTERDWGLITNQDYANMEHVQIGMKSAGGRACASTAVRRATSCTCTG